jgi:hypothetical protein
VYQYIRTVLREKVSLRSRLHRKSGGDIITTTFIITTSDSAHSNCCYYFESAP